MSRDSHSLAAALSIVAAAALAIVFSSTSRATPPNRASSPFIEPSSVSPSCGRGARRRAACDVIERFFRDVNSRKFAAACELLGAKLQSETHGYTCERFIEAGVPEPMPWAVVGARTSGHGVVVHVALGQSELDHIRMRQHRAFVGVEAGRLRILGTRIVA